MAFLVVEVLILTNRREDNVEGYMEFLFFSIESKDSGFDDVVYMDMFVRVLFLLFFCSFSKINMYDVLHG